MAIFDIVEARVVVDGEAVSEYDFPKHETTRINELKKYIEVEEGKVFEVHLNLTAVYQLPQDVNGLCFDLWLDGQSVGGRIIGPKARNKIYKQKLVLKNHAFSNGNRHYVQRYAFRKLETNTETVHDHVTALNKRTDLYGSIQIMIWPIKAGKPTTQKRSSISATEDSIPEEALKGRAITLSTRLLEPEISEPPSFVDVERIGRYPMIIFSFEYRSRESLYHLDILKRPSSPTALEDRDIDTLSPDEMRTLLRRQQDRAALYNIKREPNLGRSIRAKREHDLVVDDAGTEGRALKRRITQIEVIDLTGS